MTERERNANLKRYAMLDDIGFIGDQSRSRAQVKRDAAKTSRFIEAQKAKMKKEKSMKKKRGSRAAK